MGVAAEKLGTLALELAVEESRIVLTAPGGQPMEIRYRRMISETEIEIAVTTPDQSTKHRLKIKRTYQVGPADLRVYWCKPSRCRISLTAPRSVSIERL